MSGVGAPLLQIHGSAFGHHNFATLTPLLAKHFLVIDFDLPGFGKSRMAQESYTVEGFGEAIVGLIDALGYERVHIHGTSFGGVIGLSLAARHPEKIDRLVLSAFLARYDKAARFMRSTWKRAARDSGMTAVADLTAIAGFARAFLEQDDVEHRLRMMRRAFAETEPERFIAATEEIEKLDLSEAAKDIKAATLLIGGAEDSITPVSPGASGLGLRELTGSIKDARLVVMEDCGHYVVFEKPAEVAGEIRAFLTGA